VKKELVIRVIDKHDRRCFRVTLTEQGDRALEVTIPLVSDFQQAVLTDVSDDEKAITIKALQSIAKKLTEEKQP